MGLRSAAQTPRQAKGDLLYVITMSVCVTMIVQRTTLTLPDAFSRQSAAMDVKEIIEEDASNLTFGGGESGLVHFSSTLARSH
jgi:hypothetical protein